jgi:hypothetical protein
MPGCTEAVVVSETHEARTDDGWWPLGSCPTHPTRTGAVKDDGEFDLLVHEVREKTT